STSARATAATFDERLNIAKGICALAMWMRVCRLYWRTIVRQRIKARSTARSRKASAPRIAGYAIGRSSCIVRLGASFGGTVDLRPTKLLTPSADQFQTLVRKRFGEISRRRAREKRAL